MAPQNLSQLTRKTAFSLHHISLYMTSINPYLQEIYRLHVMALRNG